MNFGFNKKIMSWIIIFLFAVGILFFSSQNGTESNQISRRIVAEAKEAKDYISEEVRDAGKYINSSQNSGGAHQNAKNGSQPSNKKKDQKLRNFGNIRPDYNLILRKCAHFTEYFILAIFLFTALSFSGVESRKAFIITMVSCVLFATADEFHQSFIPGRTPHVTDVGIDSSGVLAALLLLKFVRPRFKALRKNTQ